MDVDWSSGSPIRLLIGTLVILLLIWRVATA